MGSFNSTQKKQQDNSPIRPQVFIEDILHEIFKYLNTQQLKTCRLVHSLWLKEATQQLRSNGHLHEIGIIAKAHDLVQLRVKDRLPLKQELSLKNFLKLIGSSKFIFPCNNFSLTIDHIISKQLKTFFEINGSEINTLSITIELEDLYDEFGHSKKMINHVVGELFLFFITIIKQMPNLKVLSIHEMPEEFNEVFLSRCGFNRNLNQDQSESGGCLSSLQTLKLISSAIPPLPIYKILKETPNLKEIRASGENLSEAHLSLFLELNKGHLLKDMIFNFQDENSLKLYNRVLDRNPKLESILKIQFTPSSRHCNVGNIAEILNKCFLQNLDFLTTIKDSCPLGSVPEIIWPPFPHLKIIGFRYYKCEVLGFPSLLPQLESLDSGLDFLGKQFPNLSQVNLDFDNGVFELSPIQVFFEYSSPIPSVTTLNFVTEKCIHFIPPIWLKYLSKLFPNVRVFRLPKFTVADFQFAAKNVWRSSFPRMTELHVTIYVDQARLHSLVDAGFTGFTKEICFNLFSKKSLRRVGSSEIEELRMNPSILDLKNLKKLKIIFKLRENLNIRAETLCHTYGFIISELSSIYAFGMYPGLELVVAVDHLKLLKHLRRALPTAAFEGLWSSKLWT